MIPQYLHSLAVTEDIIRPPTNSRSKSQKYERYKSSEIVLLNQPRD